MRWFKGLEPDELEPVIAGLTGEIVIHFRWASVGEVTPKLCHPFPITASATTRLSISTSLARDSQGFRVSLD